MLTEFALREMLEVLTATDWLAFDVETIQVGSSVNAYTDTLAGFSLAQFDQATQEIRAWYVPLISHRNDQPDPLTWEVVRPLVKDFLEDHPMLVAHHSAFDGVVLRQHGVSVVCAQDTILMSQTLDMGRAHGLKALVLDLFQYAMTTYDALVAPYQKHGPRNKKLPVSVADVPYSRLAPYGIDDAYWTLRLRARLQTDLDQRSVQARMLVRYDLLSLPILERMERAGTPVNEELLAVLLKKLDGDYERIKTEIFEAYRIPFEPSLVDTVVAVLMKAGAMTASQRQLTAQGKTSVTNGWLESLNHPVAAQILKLRQMAYSKSHYLKPFTSFVRKGRVHTHFGMNNATSGRITSGEPCLTNATGEWDDYSVRQVIQAPPGFMLVDIDLSMIQARVAAHMSGDQALLRIFREGLDIHQIAYNIIMSRPWETPVTKAQRDQGKTANYAWMFGAGPSHIVVPFGISINEARGLYAQYFRTFWGLRKFLDGLENQARRLHYTETLYGRRRYSQKLARPNRFSEQELAFEVRALVNHPIQGTEADLLKLMMLAADRYLREFVPGGWLFLQVYDELVMCVPEHDAEQTAQAVKAAMIAAVPAGSLNVPIKAEAHIGRSWSEIH
ncbi:MAG: hypothetical protein IPO08_22665 [Xanthomonadales bacterium]|nr:hypothetical protein [Xanthomonadales bacterium]